MPIYEYLCPDCRATFELKRCIDERDEQAECPSCSGFSGSRVVSLFSAVSKGSNGASRSIAGGSACGSCTPSPGGCASCGIR
ncbi:MAG: FmdB family zinc ribbon protein [Anaerolineales bacterium]